MFMQNQNYHLSLFHRVPIQIQDVTMECNALLEKKMMRPEGGDDKLALFRQQASMSAFMAITDILFHRLPSPWVVGPFFIFF